MRYDDPKAQRRYRLKQLGIIAAIGVGVFIYYAYTSNWTSTGLPNQVDSAGQPNAMPKSLWDWLDLLIVPLVLAGGGIIFSQADRANDRELAERRWRRDLEIEEDRRREDSDREEARRKLERELEEDRIKESAFQTYLDRMSDLVMDGTNNTNQPWGTIIRARTLSLLTRLDGQRKGFMLSFLSEARLIVSDTEDQDPTVSLYGAELDNLVLQSGNYARCDMSNSNLRYAFVENANFSYSDLSECDLFKARFISVTLTHANLRGVVFGISDTDKDDSSTSAAVFYHCSFAGANLRDVDFSNCRFTGSSLIGANLTNCSFRNADLSGCLLDGADFTGALLEGANLSRTHLKGAIIDEEQLAEAASLNGVTMPDGTRRPFRLDSELTPKP